MIKRGYKSATSNQNYFGLFYTSIILAFVLVLNGCITPYAMEYAEEKSTPSITYTYWHIKRVRAATKEKDEKITVFIEMIKSSSKTDSECYTLSLPFSSSFTPPVDFNSFGFHENEMFSTPHNYEMAAPYLTDYFYPLENARKKCDNPDNSKFHSGSSIPIVKMDLHENDRYHLLSILKEHRENVSSNSILFEVTFEKKEKIDSFELQENKPSEKPKVFLIYWPTEIDNEYTYPLAIRGVYESEDESSNLYYLLVLPAIIVDAIGIIILAAAHRPM